MRLRGDTAGVPADLRRLAGESVAGQGRQHWGKLLAGPAGLADAPPEVVELLLRDFDVKGTDLRAGLDGGAHEDLRSLVAASRQDRPTGVPKRL
jgi:hypothetical protein